MWEGQAAVAKGLVRVWGYSVTVMSLASFDLQHDSMGVFEAADSMVDVEAVIVNIWFDTWFVYSLRYIIQLCFRVIWVGISS